jgi:hypothetical protein
MTLPIQISQAELSEISELEREVAWKEKHLTEMKANLEVLLRAGAPIEQGRFDARLATRIGRAVPWKQVFIQRLGQAVADAVKRLYKTHVYYEVEVMEHAQPPLWQKNDGEAGAES